MKAEIHYLKNENSILHNENQQFKKKVEELEVRISELEKFQGKKHNERSAGRNHTIIKILSEKYTVCYAPIKNISIYS